METKCRDSKNRHYQASCVLNVCLGGSKDEPLCSRVYRMPDSLFRSIYIVAMNKLFNEPAHCERIYNVYISRK